MGFAMFDLNCTGDQNNFFSALSAKDDVAEQPGDSLHQLRTLCQRVPEHLVPSRLAKIAEHHDYERFEKMNGMECCECGCCSYVCPAKRPLAQSIKSMRKEILANRRKK